MKNLDKMSFQINNDSHFKRNFQTDYELFLIIVIMNKFIFIKNKNKKLYNKNTDMHLNNNEDVQIIKNKEKLNLTEFSNDNKINIFADVINKIETCRNKMMNKSIFIEDL